MNVDEYLARIGHKGSAEPTPAVLQSLHLAHMYSVPFENLDIPLGIPIVLDIQKIFEKVVNRNRGGFCYELNGLFGRLLMEIGFTVEMYAARVFGENGKPGPEFDHMLLRVDGEWIADVGFGDSFTEPLSFNLDEQKQETGSYILAEAGERIELLRNTGGGWQPQYDFTLMPRELGEYVPMCDFQQSSPDSIFTQKKVCSMATPNGRVTYANGRLIVTNEGLQRETAIENDAELAKVLYKTFGIVLEADFGRLL